MNSIRTIAAVLAVALFSWGCAESPEPELVVEPSVPPLEAVAVPLDGWALDGEPQVVVGDELFELINGGAELYHQLGFVQAAAAEYVDDSGRAISLEVFEMGDIQGAREIFAEKSGGSGEPLDVGDEAAFEGYYLNARTGTYLITITGFETDEETTDAIVRLAESVVDALGARS
ncbi:MAG: DUF6599 family protein [Thermoanaerobaculales bacterium]|jgi:hypothetical protein|nr:DUF6599 family protein [Thermoanaerobaculales bacterium]